ncbi:MAG TPA: SirB2 family protein [Telluria sp.]|nr:SirB2 family protein [Telluria sp.]
MDYTTLKHFHMGCAGASGTLFLLRGVWMLRESAQLRQRWVRIAPHIVDTLLLASAIWLAVWSGQYPGVQGWLTAKVVALLGYIVLGTIALKRGRTKGVRTAALVGALALFGYIVAVAVTKQPLPFSA